MAAQVMLVGVGCGVSGGVRQNRDCGQGGENLVIARSRNVADGRRQGQRRLDRGGAHSADQLR